MLNHISIKYFKLAVNAASYNTGGTDIACKCPICGDSKKKANSKRLHLYKKGDLELVNCFNSGCPCENKTVYSFLRDFYPNLLPQYKKETFSTKMGALKEKSLGDIFNPSLEQSKNTFQNVSEKETKRRIKAIMPIEETDIPVLYNLSDYFEDLDLEMREYLSKRLLPTEFNGKFFKAKDNITINNTFYKIKGYLVIPLYFKDLMYGFYSRSIKDKTFITFISTLGFKVWNWYGIDRTKRVYVFEAIFDGISSGKDNIIASLGAKIPDERLSKLKDVVFCLDNDTTGIKNAIEYAKKGHRIYVQPNQYPEKDFNELKINHPNLDISELIDNNIFIGLSAVTRLKMKL